MNFISLFFSFEGRVGRDLFWKVHAGMLLAWFIAVIDYDLFIIVFLCSIWSTTVLQIKRLHDLRKSGWWLLLYITYVGIVLLLYWYMCKGEPAHNMYGRGSSPQIVAASKIQLENYNQQLAEYNRSLQEYHNYSSQQNDPRQQQQVRELQNRTEQLQQMDSLKREVDELKYNQLKQEMERLSSEMKTEKQQINISVERIGDTIQDSVVSGYKKARDTPNKDDTEVE